MANVGKGLSGRTLIGKGNNASPAFESIGTESGLTNKGVVIANGNSAFTASNAATNGQLLIGATGSAPAFASLTSLGGTLTFTPGANSLNIEAAGASPLTTKGDIFTYSTDDARLPIGTDAHCLIADSTQATGNKWGVLQEAGGGTAQSTYSTGNILYASSTNTLSKLTPGGIPGGQLIIGFDNVVQWFDPRKHCILYEDFCSAKADSGGAYNWDANSGGGTIRTNQNAASTNPGYFALQTGSSSSANPNLTLFEFGGYGAFILGGGRLYCHWIIQIPTLSDGTNTFLVQVGLGDIQSSAQDNGIWFEYTHSVNSGNWTIKAENATTQTSANTSTAVTTSWVVLGMEVNAAATSVKYTVNGTEVANSPIITNIPTNNISPFAIITKSAGTSERDLLLDQFYLYQELTATR